MLTQLQLCSSFSPSMPWMTLTLNMAEGHGRVWGLWVQWAHPGGYQIKDN